MNLVSLNFITFVICIVIACLIFPQRYKWIVVGIASIYFYWGVGKRAFLTLIMVSVFIYVIALIIEKKSISRNTKRIIFILSLLLVVVWLLTIKSINYFNDHLYYIVFPLGASYVTFSLISYLVDVYMERERAERNILKFLGFSLCFLKITQGPISRYANIASTLYSDKKISFKDVSYGSQRMIYGYFKKLVIADRIALFTESIFSDVGAYSGSVIVIGTLFATFQLYCDFSGYMDIMIGIGEMLGIELEENFKHPFFSKDAAEFWRRWHITLGNWFRDYVYTPLVMSHWVKRIGKWGRKSVGRRFGNSLMKVIALSAVWILTGLWHGTGSNYILWGMYWGIIIILSNIFEEEIQIIVKILRIKTDCISWKVFQMVRTFIIFCGGILLTRVRTILDFKIAMHQILREFNITNLLYNDINLSRFDFRILLMSLTIVLIVSVIQERGSLRDEISKQNAPIRWIIYVISVSVVLLLGIYGTEYSTAGFAYANF